MALVSDPLFYREVEEGVDAANSSLIPRPPTFVGNSTAEAKPPIEEQQKVVTSVSASFVSPLARFLANKPISRPPDFEFKLIHPAGLTVLDLELIKLTAQYCAVNGSEFLTGIVQKEQRNPRFDFLKPTHMLFNYFTSLVDSYSKILDPSRELLESVEKRTLHDHVLETGIYRFEWNNQEKERKYLEMKASSKDKYEIQTIDWQDFTVVETIEFDIDEKFDGSAESNSKVSLSLNQQLRESSNTANGSRDVDMDVDMDVEIDPSIKIVSNYVPRTADLQSNQPMVMIDPVTGKQIAASQMEEHMRVQLLDPKWRIEQQRFQDKQKETSYADGSSIADNLKLLAKKRSDVFGGGSDAEMQRETVPPGVRNSREPSISEESNMQFSAPPPMHSTMHGTISSFPPPMPFYYNQAPSIINPNTLPMQMQMPFQMPLPTPLPIPQLAIPIPPMPPVLPTPPTAPYIAPSAPSNDASNPPKASEPDLIPADEFAAKYPEPISLTVKIPHDKSVSSDWNLNGQNISLQISVTSFCKALKEELATHLGNMPVNKQQLKIIATGMFLKDANSLAAANVGDGAVLELILRSRGGKR